LLIKILKKQWQRTTEGKQQQLCKNCIAAHLQRLSVYPSPNFPVSDPNCTMYRHHLLQCEDKSKINIDLHSELTI
jgi:hypothetical protein